MRNFHHDLLCPALPILDHLSSHMGNVNASTGSLITRLSTHLQPAGVFVLGKPDSINELVFDFLRDCYGCSAHPESLEQSLIEPGDKLLGEKIMWLMNRCRQWLLGNKSSPQARAILIDDGGKAIRLLHEPEFDDVRPLFSCVEQTRRGIMELEGVDLEVPVINVAESWVKLQHESPLIANSVVSELFKQLQRLTSFGIPVRREALILGYGAIGRAIALELRQQGRWNISVYDADQTKRAKAAHDDGFQAVDSLREALQKSGLVVGCTGKTSLAESDYSYVRPGAVLVSASSSDIEL